MELINKEDAVALIKAEMDKIRTHSLVDGTARINLRLAKNIIEDMPTIDITDYVPREFHDKTCEAMAKAHQKEIADMVSVVRCKECRFCLVGVATAQYSNGKQRIENLCEKHKWSVRADDFCSYGEREGE